MSKRPVVWRIVTIIAYTSTTYVPNQVNIHVPSMCQKQINYNLIIYEYNNLW